MAKHARKKTLIIVLSITASLIVVSGAVLLGIFGADIISAIKSTSTPVEPSSSVDEPSSVMDSSSSQITSSEEPEPEITLSVTSPEKESITINKPQYTIKGSGDPAYPVTINGEEITLSESGLFAHTVELLQGQNKVVVSQRETNLSFNINYQFAVIKSIDPSSGKTLESKSPLAVSCIALKGSTVTATFNGNTITLQTAKNDEDAIESEYEEFVGSFETPVNQGNTKSYGEIKFKATSQHGTTTKYSGKIMVKKFDVTRFDGGNGYPEGSGYLNVGTTYVMEVVHLEAETFDAKENYDPSSPTNNYLPKGTVDYCSPYEKSFKSSGKELKLYTARYGKQLYEICHRGTRNISIYKGSLPETNNVSLDSLKTVGHHSVMTLNVDWKAPFKFEYKPQSYKNPSVQNYNIDAPTFTYIDITFCYAESFTGLPDFGSSPVFSSAEIIRGTYDVVLRLHLREKGKFYGWSAEYNSQGQLEFWFLNPVTLTPAENEYGVSLEGVTILVDAGHGGTDSGASGYTSGIHEQHLNLRLAREVEKQLKALGATVIMTRSDNGTVTSNERIAIVKKVRPDYVVSIHRNSNEYVKASGFSSYYFNPYSFEAANVMLDAVNTADVFEQTKWTFVRWHLFFLCRVTDCPTVLTENGFVSNMKEYEKMKTEEQNLKNAKAIVDGIVNYFKNR